MLHQHFAGEVAQGAAETGGALLADDQFRPRAEQGDMPRRWLQQGGGEALAGVAVVADHRAEALRIELAVDGDHRHPFGEPEQLAVVAAQATGDDQRIAAPRAEQVEHLLFAFRLVVGAGDQQLVAAGAGALFEQLGELGIAGVLQVREDEAEGAGLPAAQAGGLLVGVVAVFLDHRAHAFHRGAADAPLLGLAIDHVAGGGDGNAGQTGDITEFQRNPWTAADDWGLQGSRIIE
ncbi:hypothetical protein D3C76_948270 [compost metagenome]